MSVTTFKLVYTLLMLALSTMISLAFSVNFTDVLIVFAFMLSTSNTADKWFARIALEQYTSEKEKNNGSIDKSES